MIPYVFHLFNGNMAVKSIVIITLVWLALALGLAAWQMQKFVDFRAKHTLYTWLVVITVMAAIARSILVVPIVLDGNLTYGAFIMLQVAQHMQDLGLSLLPIAAVHFCFIATGKRLASGVAGWMVILSYLMAIVITLAWIANFFIVFYLISNALFFWFCIPYLYFGMRYFKSFGATFALYCCFHVLAIIFPFTNYTPDFDQNQAFYATFCVLYLLSPCFAITIALFAVPSWKSNLDNNTIDNYALNYHPRANVNHVQPEAPPYKAIETPESGSIIMPKIEVPK